MLMLFQLGARSKQACTRKNVTIIITVTEKQVLYFSYPATLWKIKRHEDASRPSLGLFRYEKNEIPVYR